VRSADPDHQRLPELNFRNQRRLPERVTYALNAVAAIRGGLKSDISARHLLLAHQGHRGVRRHRRGRLRPGGGHKREQPANSSPTILRPP